MLSRFTYRPAWRAGALSLVGLCLVAATGSVAVSCEESCEEAGVVEEGVTFRVCGTADAALERAIEEAVAGRAFNATLVGRPDGCADLTIQVTSAAAMSPGSRVESSLSMSLDGGQGVSIQIVSEDGATHVILGPGG